MLLYITCHVPFLSFFLFVRSTDQQKKKEKDKEKDTCENSRNVTMDQFHDFIIKKMKKKKRKGAVNILWQFYFEGHGRKNLIKVSGSS